MFESHRFSIVADGYWPSVVQRDYSIHSYYQLHRTSLQNTRTVILLALDWVACDDIDLTIVLLLAVDLECKRMISDWSVSGNVFAGEGQCKDKDSIDKVRFVIPDHGCLMMCRAAPWDAQAADLLSRLRLEMSLQLDDERRANGDSFGSRFAFESDVRHDLFENSRCCAW
ncbi:hypothetical protein CC79DRAFT_1145163 [Sarocladium strictum]